MSTKQRNYFRTGNITRFPLSDLIKKNVRTDAKVQEMPDKTKRNQKNLRLALRYTSIPYVHLAAP